VFFPISELIDTDEAGLNFTASVERTHFVETLDPSHVPYLKLII